MRYNKRTIRQAVWKVVNGSSREDIAKEYGVSVSTVCKWVWNLLPSLGTTSELKVTENSLNIPELLNESLSEAVKEYLLYGAHPLSTEEDSDDIWDDAELFNLKLTNGDVIDCSELADEVLDAQKRYLNGLPVMQSIPTKEVK